MEGFDEDDANSGHHRSVDANEEDPKDSINWLATRGFVESSKDGKEEG